VRDFNRFFEIRIPESREYTTVAGFLQTRTGRLLQSGESVRYLGLEFVIDKVDGMKIMLVRVRGSAAMRENSSSAKSSHE
jgi:CBS domain containing-hemolysin-like protein